MERRDFLKSAAAAAATTTVTAQAAEPKKEKQLPGDIVIERPGSDFMVDVIKALKLDYMATNPGAAHKAIRQFLAA
jgi:anaerobic selenocysteine-containing dehydrogenase